MCIRAGWYKKVKFTITCHESMGWVVIAMTWLLYPW
jgi:hypothetical protein